MSAPLAYLNGRFLPQSEASLPLHDAGFVMGATVTDFCRTFKHVLFRWPDHLARFRRDCAACFIPLPQTDAELTIIADELIAHNRSHLAPGQELALISFATPGPIGYYLGEPGGAGEGPPTLGMHTFPLPFARYRRFFTEGVSLKLPLPECASLGGSLTRYKHRSRLYWWLAERRLRSSEPLSHHQALLMETVDGGVTETAIGNFLLVRDGVLLSPPHYYILEGISRRVIQELSHELGIPFKEDDLTLDLCQDADEAMLCGSAFCLAGVSRINDWSIPWPGPVCTRLLNAWSERVGLDIAQQFLANP